MYDCKECVQAIPKFKEAVCQCSFKPDLDKCGLITYKDSTAQTRRHLLPNETDQEGLCFFKFVLQQDART